MRLARSRTTDQIATREPSLAPGTADSGTERPDVWAWLYPRLGGVLPQLELVVANIGPGTVKKVRWWYEEVDREEWQARRIGGLGWADSGNMGQAST